jgi:hypothetical protein
VRRRLILLPTSAPLNHHDSANTTSSFFAALHHEHSQGRALRSYFSDGLRLATFMPSAADVHHFLIFEALAEIRYRPMSAPSVAQVAGNVQKRDSTKGHRS